MAEAAMTAITREPSSADEAFARRCELNRKAALLAAGNGGRRPDAGEVIQAAAQTFDRDVAKLSCCAA